uniref:NADH-ubiquinone oxidoreductase chain 4 n=1 Tax=Dolicheulota formosensis TaxID=1632114 RepID=A0A0H3W560_DOLFO|nr:NADH dehydrogenase subunit 4 [Dolicheulota formosensis]AKJ85732.1 NADH dehydrogenase subunit 4 [Dolicheulota formosensis]
MITMLIGLIFSMLVLGYFELLVLFSIMVPLSMLFLYKTNIYLEDFLLCMNDMNGLLIFMTLSLALFILISSWSILSKDFLLLQVSVVLVLVICFLSNNLLLFYISFESSLLPILFMIIGWGYQPERLQAGMYMILYTVFGSMPLLLILLYTYFSVSTFNLYYLLVINLSGFPWYFSLGLLAFLVKLPIYSLHVWLPKAHVEAPVAGSMILAGALLKLGGYGLYVYTNIWCFAMSDVIFVFLICLAVWGGCLAAVACLFQSDLKAMIAYSSVVHMALVVLGIFSGTSWGFSCALITMIAHGWASSGLFLLSYITYEKVQSRSFNYIKGLLSLHPSLTLFWFILALINMAVPPTINLVGELMAVPVAAWLSFFLLFTLLIIMFLSVSYNMYMYSKVNHGPIGLYIVSSKSLSSAAMLATLVHVFPLVLLFGLNLFSLYTEYCM